MRAGEIVFTGMDRVTFGRPAAEAVVQAAERLGARRVFILAGATLNRKTDVIARIAKALGERYAGVHDDMPAHSPRDAVVACANKAREAGCDLLLSVGGGSTTDGGKAVTLRFNIDNLTNEKYWLPSWGFILAQGAPRTFRASATINF